MLSCPQSYLMLSDDVGFPPLQTLSRSLHVVCLYLLLMLKDILNFFFFTFEQLNLKCEHLNGLFFLFFIME